MELVKQPKNSNLCGQAVCATVASISLEKSIEIFGHSGKTKTWELVKALKACNIRVDEKLGIAPHKHKEGWGSAVVMIIHYVDKANKIEHWMIADHGVIMDPAGRHTGKATWDDGIGCFIKSAIGIRGVIE